MGVTGVVHGGVCGVLVTWCESGSGPPVGQILVPCPLVSGVWLCCRGVVSSAL